MTDLELVRLTEINNERDDRVASLEAWRPGVDGVIGDIRLELGRLSKHWNRTVGNGPTGAAGIMSPPEWFAEHPPAGATTTRPYGHRVERGHGVVTTLAPNPTQGMETDPPYSIPRFHGQAYDNYTKSQPPDSSNSNLGRLPKMNFPTFDGENTRLWISRAENYFDMYTVDSALWVKVAGMHFTGIAARWIQSVDSKLKQLSWPLFCKLLHDRFGRDQHETLLRQLFHIHQTSTVVDYVDRFASLIDQLAAYEPTTDMLYFTTRFIDGLSNDIRSVISVQRPSNLDTAYSLALLQEEMVDISKKPAARYEAFNGNRHAFRGAVTFQKTNIPDKPIDKTVPAPTPSADDKISALRSYRRAKGLCDRCAEKWTKGHRCSTTIQLHAMEEVWELFNLEALSDSEEVPEQICLALSMDAMSGKQGPKSIQLNGSILGVPVTILVDSGSSASFLNIAVADQLPQLKHSPCCTSVKVANGAILHCSSVILGCALEVGICQFSLDLKILQLGSYDLVLGLDWLEQFSPMKVHWKQKWLAIPYQGSTVVLQGMVPDQDTDSIVQLLSIEDQPDMVTVSSFPPEIQSILDDYSMVFTPPSELPPERSCDQNLSNLLRLALLYRYGGIYLDADVVVLRPLSDLRNAIGAQAVDEATGDWMRLNNAVMVFDRAHPLLREFIAEFAASFDGSKWGHNGPYLVSRVAARLRHRSSELDLTVLPPQAFYPVNWSKIGGLFVAPKDRKDEKWVKAKVENIKRESFGIHLWNRESRRLEMEERSVIGTLISDSCLFCNSSMFVKQG